LLKIFKKNVVITSDHGRPQGGKGISPLEIETKHQDSLEKLVAQFRSID